MPEKRQLTVHGPGHDVGGRAEDHLLEDVVELDAAGSAVPSAVTTSTSLITSSAALSTISPTVSCTMASMARVPVKVAVATFGLDLHAVRLGLDRAGQPERL